MTKSLLTLAVASFFAIGAPASAVAQDIGGYQAWGSSYVTIGINGAMMDAATESSRGYDPNEPEPAASADPATLTYKPSLERRRANFADFVAKTKSVDPVGAKMLADVFAEGDVIAQIDAGIRQYGLRADNFADTYTLYWISAWQAAHSDYRDITPAITQAVKRQAEEAILSSPDFVSMSDADKQKLSEAYMIQAVQIGQAQDIARADPAFEERLSTAVMTGASKSGFDIEAFDLTDEGFVLVM